MSPASSESNESVDSSCTDSGKGGSEVQSTSYSPSSQLLLPEQFAIAYQFELANDLCGRLIGVKGKFAREVKNNTGVNIVINDNPLNASTKICHLEGYRDSIRSALGMIRARFPSNAYPEVTLQLLNAVPATPCFLPFIPGVEYPVIMSSLINAGHFFLQQPTHPAYSSLAMLNDAMASTYTDFETPTIPEPTRNMVVAAPIMGGWYRAIIVAIPEEGLVDVRFVDYGGYSRMSVSSLRQIRMDFMVVPFQANECYLADVIPIEGNAWSSEATKYFESLAQGQILQVTISGYTQNGCTLVRVYRTLPVGGVICLNDELVHRGFAQWFDHMSLAHYVTDDGAFVPVEGNSDCTNDKSNDDQADTGCELGDSDDANTAKDSDSVKITTGDLKCGESDSKISYASTMQKNNSSEITQATHDACNNLNNNQDESKKQQQPQQQQQQQKLTTKQANATEPSPQKVKQKQQQTSKQKSKKSPKCESPLPGNDLTKLPKQNGQPKSQGELVASH